MMVEMKQKTFTTRDIVLAAGGEEYGENIDYSVIEGVSIDSRTCSNGTLFVPIKGERTDGHNFIESALQNGATASFIAERYWREHREALKKCADAYKAWFIIVEEPLHALGNMAEAHLRSFDNLLRIGITGSNGKTTTKEMIGRILSLDRPTAVNEGNYNSEIGLPLAALQVTEEHRAAVFEMGMNRKGEMDILAEIVKPDIAVITNIGTAHIGLLGSQQAIAEEKKKIFSHFSGNQTGFIREDEPWFDFLSENVNGTILPYGEKSLPGLESWEIKGLLGNTIRWRGVRINVPAVGEHNSENSFAALAVTDFLGIDVITAKRGLEGYKPLSGRGEILLGTISIIQDCYNANLESFIRSLAFFRDLPWSGRKCAVIGPMKELGAFSEKSHRELGEIIKECPLDMLFFVGEETKEAYAVVQKDRGNVRESFWFENYQSLESKVLTSVRTGDCVLLKGSRTAQLERLVPKLQQGGKPGGER
jgi:UDP-N-acetylmuramoyl-tripeptide--D-alanyl-D-alanine ligase